MTQKASTQRGIAFEGDDAVPAQPGRQHMLVVGINDYGSRHPRLQNAVSDAIAVHRRLLDDFGYGGPLLLDGAASAVAVRDALENWHDVVAPEDDVLVFCAGHGASIPGPDGQPCGYLIPADGGDDTGSWLAEGAIIDAVRRLRAGRVFVVFDACYSGTALRISDRIEPDSRHDQVIKILVAGTESQPVLDGGAGEHSIFTRALLDGIDGLADAGLEPDGVVTARELITYVCSEVQWRSRVRQSDELPAQTPVGGTVQARPDGVDFALTPLHPRLPTPLLRNLSSSHVEDRLAAVRQMRTLRGSNLAPLAARELTAQLSGPEQDAPRVESPVRPGQDLGDLRRLQRAAATSLGALGEPAGFAPLTKALTDAPLALRARAAEALGHLVATSSETHPEFADVARQDAMAQLIDLLAADVEDDLLEGAKAGLSHVPSAASSLASRIATAPRHRRSDHADALAYIAMLQPEHPQAWPRLPPGPATWRRYHLSRRRLGPILSALAGHAAALAVAGAVGLALAYLVVTLTVFPDDLRSFAPGVVAVGAIPGAIAGVGLATAPVVTSSASRSRSPASNAVGGLLAGLLLAPAMWVPDWYLGVGCRGGCPPNTDLLWLIPGLVLGPALGLATSLSMSFPGGRTGAKHGPALLVGVAVVGFTLARIPAPLTFGWIEPRAGEVAAWAIGGLLFGLSLAGGWATSRTRRPTGGGSE